MPENIAEDLENFVFGATIMVLSQQEIDSAREAFASFDTEGSGHIDVWQLRRVLKSLGHEPNDNDLFTLISSVDTDYSGSIDFEDFVTIVERQILADNEDDEFRFLLDAFIACGAANKDGLVTRDTLVKVIKHDFGLNIDIEELIRNVDKNEDGEIDFAEFKVLLSS